MKKILFVFSCLCLLTSAIQAQTRVIKGVVTSQSDKSPLIGATVLNKATKSGVATDTEGAFSLKVSKGDTLIFSFIGYVVQTVVITNQKELKIAMAEDSKTLDEVVSIGYLTRKKGTLTGSVSVVGTRQLEMMPLPNFDQALQGQTPGMLVMSSSGAPGAAASVAIRGVNSISAGTTPLYIMDGVVVSAGDFQALNSADIESVTILKDAASTAIYGARAANGVMVITTKRGKFGSEARVNFRAQFGWSTIANGENDMMNTQQRLDYEELVGMHQNDLAYDRADYEGIDVDWRKVIYNDNAPTSSYDLSISGGSESIAYYLSANYMTQEGIAPLSDFTRYNFRLNWEGKVKPWMKAGGSMTLGHNKDYQTSTLANSTLNPANAALFMLPYVSPYKEDGSIASVNDDSWKGDGINPLEAYKGFLVETDHTKTVGSLFLELNLLKGLSLKTMLGLDGAVSHDISVSMPSYPYNNGEGSVSERYTRTYALTMTNTLNYMFDLNDRHHFNILLGQEAIQAQSRQMIAAANGLSDDRLIMLSSAITPVQAQGAKSEYSFLSFFGHASYALDNKYFLDLSVRTDGSSRFGKDNRFATFCSAGLMWRVSDESFMNNSGVISNLQLLASIGTAGNSSIGNYDHMALIVGGASYVGTPAWVPTGLGNESLTWEKLRDINIGIKLGLWNRINLDLAYYNKLTTDMLMSVPLSITNGFSSWLDNIGKMRNQGIDLQLDANVLNLHDFRWNFSGNVSYNQNKILELYGGQDSYVVGNSGTILKVGEPMGTLQAVRYAGVNPANGDALWYDKNGKLTNKYTTDDEVLLGKTSMAPWYGGFTNTFSYKGWQLSVFFTWIAGRYMINNTRYFSESNGRFPTYNQTTKMLEVWREPGQITEVPRYGVVTEMDDHLLEDASFMRLKNLSLAYNFPMSILKHTGVIQGVKIFAQAQNLLTFTKWTGFDPESPGNLSLGNYPMTKQFMFGFDVTF